MKTQKMRPKINMGKNKEERGDDRKVRKRKAPLKADTINKRKPRKEKVTKRDPNKPKRPATSFFVFMEEFRKTYKKEHPNIKGVSAVGKAAGEKWKSMSSSEKSPYESESAKRKVEYEKLMKAYKKNKEDTVEDDKKASEGLKSDESSKSIYDASDEESEEVKRDDDRKTGKMKAPLKSGTSNKRKLEKGKSTKSDAKEPKMLANAFNVFMEEFEKTYKKEHPIIKGNSAVVQDGAEKWKSMSSGEKLQYEDEAAKRKVDYENLVEAYKKKQEDIVANYRENSERSSTDEESSRSTSANDEDSDEESEEDGDEDSDEDSDEESEEEEEKVKDSKAALLAYKRRR